MFTPKFEIFLILLKCYVVQSGIANEAIITILIFFTKKFWVCKNANQIKTNQQNKIKRIKNNKSNSFSRIKTSKRGTIVHLAFLKKAEIVLLVSFTILLNYAVSTLPLSNYFYPYISSHKTLWPDRQDKGLLIPRTFKNAGSKPVRNRFHSWWTLTLKELLDT